MSRATLAAAASGALFGVGLALSSMTDRQVVLGFLDVAGAWNPTLAFVMGGSVEVYEDPVEALAGAEAVYTDVWLSMGDSESEREERQRRFAPYQVNERLLAQAAPGAIFMHCLPAHRGEEVTEEVMDGPRSVAFDQVENRAHTEQAVLIALLERRLHGSRAWE